MTSEKRIARPADDEQAFLAAYDAAQFPHPSVAVDVALVTADGGRLRAVLTERMEHPAKGRWSLPGGFVQMDESLDAAAARVLETKLGVRGIFLEQLYTFGRPDRDPRTRVISVAYYALVDAGKLRPLTPGPSPARGEGSNAGFTLATLRVAWQGEQGGPVEAHDENGKKLPLAFDHADILGLVVQRLRGKLDYAPIGFELLPREFTLRQLQTIHETILGRTLNKDSFRRRLLASGLIAPTGKLEEAVDHRPAELYRFAARAPRSKRAARKSPSPPTSRKE
jgi:8-oxo-dGTP diphosphatase